MKLPRFTAETSPPRETGLVRAQDIGALTRTGDAAVWRGVSQVGGAMMDVAGLGFDAYQNRKALDDVIEWGTATQRATGKFGEAEDAANRIDVTMDMPMPDDPDYLKTLTSFSTAKKEELLAEAIKGIEADAKKLSQGFSTPEGKARFENWYNKNRANVAEKLGHMYGKKLDDYQIETIDSLWQSAAQNGDTETAEHYIDLMDKFELITPKQASVRKGQVEKIANRSLLDAIYETAKEMPYADAIGFINDMPGLESADRNDLIARRKRQNEIETATTNRKVRWDTLRKVTDNPDSITDDYLESLVKPDSLTWDDAEEFKKIRDTENHPLKTSRYKLYSGILDAVYVDVTKPEGEVGLDRILEYDQKNTELQNFFETNPDAQSPEKTKKFFNDLAAKAQGDWLNKLWDLFVIGTGGKGFLPRKGKKTETPETTAIRLESAPAIEFDKIWPSLTDKQKTNVWAALDNGYASNEILAALEKK